MNSDDIVTRLRQEHVVGWIHPAGECVTCDAADEIKRLRKKLDSFGTTCQALRDKIRLRALDELTAQAEELGLYDALPEIERLRALGDALVMDMRHLGELDSAYDAPQRAWEEARRGDR